MAGNVPNPESYPYLIQDHERRLTALEREKLATEVALVKRDVADIKQTQERYHAETERRFDTLETKVDSLMGERDQRQGGRGVWRNALTIGLVSVVLVSGLILQLLSYLNGL